MKITITSKATISSDRDEDVTNLDVLKHFDGLSGQDKFSDYADDDLRKVISGGHLNFFRKNREIWVETTYDVICEKVAELLPHINNIIEYTSGQWADGIGEGFEQEPREFEGIFYYIQSWGWKQEYTFSISEASLESLI
jgi:hypothetical protein